MHMWQKTNTNCRHGFTLRVWSNTTSNYYCTLYILYPLFFQHVFFQSMFLRLNKRQKKCFYSHFSYPTKQNDRPKTFKKKNSLKQKCEWNLFKVRLFPTNIAFYFKCLVRVVLEHQLWTLVTFTICFSVFCSWTNRINISTKLSSHICKKYSILKKHTHCIMIILCQRTWKNKQKSWYACYSITLRTVEEKTKPGYILYLASNPKIRLLCHTMLHVLSRTSKLYTTTTLRC